MAHIRKKTFLNSLFNAVRAWKKLGIKEAINNNNNKSKMEKNYKVLREKT